MIVKGTFPTIQYNYSEYLNLFFSFSSLQKEVIFCKKYFHQSWQKVFCDAAQRDNSPSVNFLAIIHRAQVKNKSLASVSSKGI